MLTPWTTGEEIEHHTKSGTTKAIASQGGLPRQFVDGRYALQCMQRQLLDEHCEVKRGGKCPIDFYRTDNTCFPSSPIVNGLGNGPMRLISVAFCRRQKIARNNCSVYCTVTAK